MKFLQHVIRNRPQQSPGIIKGKEPQCRDKLKILVAIIFFLEHAGELRIIILKRKIGERAPYSSYQYMTNHLMQQKNKKQQNPYDISYNNYSLCSKRKRK
jgi:hypothetical protein